MGIKSLALSLAVGSLLAVGCAHHKEKEETVSLDSVPAAVREGINKQLNGGTATKIERETKHGKTVYEVQTMRDGKKAEFKVGEDGMLVAKDKMKAADKDNEEHEDKDKDGKEDDEKEEHHKK